MKRLLGAALALAMLLAVGVATADPLFTIITTAGSNQEAAGQASGMQYPWPQPPTTNHSVPGPGAGLPTTDTSPSPWPGGVGNPISPGFAQEPGHGQGISGFDASYLQVNRTGRVTFQFMGAGDSSFANSFWLFYDAGDGKGTIWHQLFQDGGNSGPTAPCPVTPDGAMFPNCDQPAPTPVPCPDLDCNQYTILLDEGLIPFAFDLGGSDSTPGGPFAGPINAPNTLWTNGIPEPGAPQYAGAMGNPPDESPFPGYFLGCDPYLATGPFQTTCESAAYIGLADRPRINAAGDVLDHDYQDMVIRVIPEPGSLLLLGAGLIALAGLRRRKA